MSHVLLGGAVVVRISHDESVLEGVFYYFVVRFSALIRLHVVLLEGAHKHLLLLLLTSKHT